MIIKGFACSIYSYKQFWLYSHLLYSINISRYLYLYGLMSDVLIFYILKLERVPKSQLIPFSTRISSLVYANFYIQMLYLLNYIVNFGGIEPCMSVFVLPIEFRAIICLFGHSMWLGDLSSPTRDQTQALSSESMKS